VSIEGESAVFTCELSKPGAPVEWRKGRVILKAGAKYHMKLEGRLTKLVINNLVEDDAGNYTCKTKDSQSTAKLMVQGNIQIIAEFLTLWISYAFHFHDHVIFFLLALCDQVLPFHLKWPFTPQLLLTLVRLCDIGFNKDEIEVVRDRLTVFTLAGTI